MAFDEKLRFYLIEILLPANCGAENVSIIVAEASQNLYMFILKDQLTSVIAAFNGINLINSGRFTRYRFQLFNHKYEVFISCTSIAYDRYLDKIL